MRNLIDRDKLIEELENCEGDYCDFCFRKNREYCGDCRVCTTDAVKNWIKAQPIYEVTNEI